MYNVYRRCSIKLFNQEKKMETKSRNELIVSLSKEGKPQKEIAKITKCSVPTVSNVLRGAGISSYTNSNYGVVKKNKDKILAWIEEGWSSRAIAKELGCAKSSVQTKLLKWGIKTNHKSKRDDDNLLKDKESEAIELYNSGMSINEVGKTLGHTGPSVAVLLRKAGIEIRDDRYPVDEDFFKVIDTEDKAYILGWFYSDGCVDLKGKCRIQIQTEDIAMLEQIKVKMGYGGPLYDVPPPKKFPERKNQTCLCINRQTLAKDLIKLGCVPHKSLNLYWPTTEQVPDHLISHFVRGVFDGDGSLVVKKDKYLNASITGCDTLLDPLRIILRGLGIDTKHYYRYSHTNTVSMMITKTAHAQSFMDWLYQDASFYLTRKFDKYQNYLKTVYNIV